MQASNWPIYDPISAEMYYCEWCDEPNYSHGMRWWDGCPEMGTDKGWYCVFCQSGEEAAQFCPHEVDNPEAHWGPTLEEWLGV